MNGNLFVFRPSGTQIGNVFNDWPSLISAMSGVEGRKILEFDDSLVAADPPHCEIPAGQWPMKDVMWAGFGPRPGVPRTVVYILSGAEFTDLRMIGGQITIVNTVMPPFPSPVSDFSPKGDHVQIGLRDDCGNTQIVNQRTEQGNAVPMFDLGSNPALFFVQNCLFVMPLVTQPITSISPLIRQSAGSKLTLNLLGQNQTGPNLVLSETGASVLFAALSSAAQVAVEQRSITNDGGTFDFGPQGRIQRQVVPRPPAPPATGSQTFNKPNVLIRCDGTSPGFTQDLPGIADGFTISSGGVKLYSGGQEVVVAEVVGGSHLKVRPAPGDTIDGGPGLVHIGKHGSRTFVSDGVSNWITISEVHNP
jgi:hypothetical protein